MAAPHITGALRSVLDRLTSLADQSKRPRPRRAGAGWVACCPAHDDRSPSLSIGMSDAGNVLLNCMSGCAFGDVARALGMTEQELFGDYDPSKSGEHRVDEPPRRPSSSGRSTSSSKRHPGLTLAQYAAAKGLHVDALVHLGVTDTSYYGRRAVEFAYPKRGGGHGRSHLRVRLEHDPDDARFRWADKSAERHEVIAYEPDLGELARQQRQLLVVEGESDVLTLLVAGFGALGVPGTKQTGCIEREHVDGIEHVFVVREPDPAGERFAADVSTRLGGLGYQGGVHVLDLVRDDGERVDVSDLYLADPSSFGARLRQALDRVQEPPPKSTDLLDLIDGQVSDGIVVKTGLAGFDRACDEGGLETGTLMVLLGGPGSKKTGALTQLLDVVTRDGCAGLLMAFDERSPKIVTRLGQRMGLSRRGLRDKGEAGQATRALHRERERALKRTLRIVCRRNKNDARTIEEAHLELVRMHAQSQCRARVLLIDSLQTVKCAASEALEASDTRGRIDAKMDKLLDFTATGTIVIIVSETKRTFYSSGEGNKRIEKDAVLGAAKESGDIEYSADVIVGLVRDKEDDDLVELVVAKSRIGREPRLKLRWDRDRATLSELEPEEAQAQATRAAESPRDTARKVETDEVSRLIVDALRRDPGMTDRELCAAINKGRPKVDIALAGLIRRGVIVKTKRGKRNEHELAPDRQGGSHDD